MLLGNLFFELLQVAIGNRKSLSRTPSEGEWGELYAMATRQALIGICFVGVQKLSITPQPYTINLQEALRLRWLGMAAKIQLRNKVVSDACVELVKQYTHDGIQCCILKGQSNLWNYPEELREARIPGDIDVWCVPQDSCGVEIAVSDLDGKGAHYEHYVGKRGVIEYVKQLWRIAGKQEPKSSYLHIDAPDVNGVPVEVHLRPAFLNSPLRNYRLQKWFEEQQMVSSGIGGIPMPTNSFNAVFQLAHMYKHLIDEGVGLRQLLDYYFVLRALHIEQGEFSDRYQSMAQWAEGMGLSVASNIEIMHQIERFGMKRFASAVMYVLQEVFAMPKEYCICSPSEKDGRFLLSEIMQSGNFGQHDERLRKIDAEYGTLPFKIKRAHRRFARNWQFVTSYPEEVIWEPVARGYHWAWKVFCG